MTSKTAEDLVEELLEQQRNFVYARERISQELGYGAIDQGEVVAAFQRAESEYSDYCLLVAKNHAAFKATNENPKLLIRGAKEGIEHAKEWFGL